MSTEAQAPPVVSTGRPIEIEEWSNRWLVHPLSRGVVRLLIPTPITPNMVSVGGAVMAAFAALAFLTLAWPASALVGAACLLGWHVLDGADGDLARRTGRASTNGELVDGICDHAGQAAIYIAFALMLQPGLGGWAWALSAAAAGSRAVQASAYEGLRRNYRRWVYGTGWIRQNLDALEAGGGRGLKIALGRAYIAVSSAAGADDRALEAEMERLARSGGAAMVEARELYKARVLPLVKAAGVLCANYRSLAMALAVLVRQPVAFLVFELVVLNGVLVLLRTAEARAIRDLSRRLGEL